MSLERHLNQVLSTLLTRSLEPDISNEELIHSMDLTLLDPNATPEALNWIVKQASNQPVAAVCVFIKHLKVFQSFHTQAAIATVINFPQGHDSLMTCMNEIDQAFNLGADEIDYVFPYSSYLSNKKQDALDHCDAIGQECKRKNLQFKVIIETSAFQTMSAIYQVSKEIIALGCDFLKTSTGKSAEGATLSAVFAMLCAIKDSNCGIKISGGIKTIPQALNYARLAELMNERKIDPSWFRIGASTLLNDILT